MPNVPQLQNIISAISKNQEVGMIVLCNTVISQTILFIDDEWVEMILECRF